MSPRERKLIISFGIVLIVFLILIVIWDLSKSKQTLGPTIIVPDYSSYLPDNQSTTTATLPLDWEETADRKAVPTGTKVPEVNEVIPDELKEIIAVPKEVIPAEANLRVFDIKGENGKLVPEKIIINYNDIVHINFMAIDGDYNVIFSGYNMMLSAKAGETKIMGFAANQDGRFTYYCEECGGFSKTVPGEIIVVK